MKKIFSVLIYILIIVGSLFLTFFYVPCYIWTVFKHFEKTEFFGNYYGTLISATLALSGVALSLIVANYQTRKSINDADNRAQQASKEASKHTKTIINESKKRLKVEKLNNLEIQIMIVNYQTLNKLNSHIQELDASFVKSEEAINDMNGFTADCIRAASEYNISSSYSSDNNIQYSKTILNQIGEDINDIELSIKKYKVFHNVYEAQIRNLFQNTPKYINFIHEKAEMNKELNKIKDRVLWNINKNLNDLLTKDHSSGQTKSSIKQIEDSISDVINILSNINNLSFKFGKNLENYIKD